MPHGRASGSGPQWEHADDIPLDDQDEFLQNRDHIVLGSGSNSRSRQDPFQDDDNAQEVFRLQHSEEEDDEDDDDDDDEDEDMELSAPSRSTQKRKQATVTGGSAGDEDSDTDSDTSVADRAHFGRSKRSYYASTNALDSASEAGSDGATTDEENELAPEQRRQMELREVRKMAVTARKGMVERDFGLEDGIELATASGSSVSDAVGGDGKSAEQLARDRRRAALLGDQVSDLAAASTDESQSNVHVSLPTDPTIVAAMLRDLHAKDALTLALAGEFADTMHEWTVLEQGMTKATAELPSDHPSFSLMHIYQQTFLTYLTTLTFYFYLRTSPTYSPSPTNPDLAQEQLRNLRGHPVIARLTELKEALSNMEDLGFRVDQAETSDLEDDLDDLPPVFRDEAGDYSAELGDLEDGELEDLLADEKENQALTIFEDPPSFSDALPSPSPPAAKPKTKKSKRSSASAVEAARGPLAELEDLVPASIPTSAATKRKALPPAGIPDAEAAEALGELTSLTAAEKAEKQARKRSLRFYTGQIAARDANAPSSSRMSGNSRASALSGDADIPYTDRDRSRKAVEAAAEAKRARAAADSALSNGSAGVALDDSDAWGEDDAKAWREIMGGGELPSSSMSRAGPSQLGPDVFEGDGDDQDDGAEYYDLVATAAHQRKKAKKDAYDEARLEERYQPDDTLAEGEHRGLNRTIEKNRGLTPHRPKAVRNPRVKKRIKYESAKKKLSSSRPTYKGGQSSLEGGYGGEKSGISEGIVR
ncbi:something about silencing protein 10, partial [Tilletia horrida]